ncbi:MAG: recombinase family protein [Oscillospiraceae bacterium]|nr:recombinase family protein [Oscillospiraceae bacterium]
MDIYAAANRMKQERITIFDLPINVTFYARVSTTREEQENSIESQILYFTEMIRSNPNWNYVEGYVDRVRGENAENRTSFMQMIEDGKNGRFDLILTKEVSRFARNTIDSLTYTRDLLRAGVGVFFQNDNICTIDTDSEMRLTIMSSIAADEVRKLSERVRWGHKRSIERGNVLGNNRIFGYDKIDCRLVINEKEAEMVRTIFELYATGDYSTRRLERLLYEKGYRGRNGTRIHHNTITGIIRNPKYKGYYCGNKVKIIDYRTREQRFLPEDQWVMYKDETGEVVPAIISEEIWEQCNRILEEHSSIIKSRSHSF